MSPRFNFFMISSDSEWGEILEEFFEETYCSFKRFSSESEFQSVKKEVSDLGFDLGFIDPKTFSGSNNSLSSIPCIKLGSGEVEGTLFRGCLGKILSTQSITQETVTALGQSVEPVRIMLVDDDPDLCLVLKDDWENKVRYKTQVNVQPNGLEALKALNSFQPDVVVIDLKMPTLSGSDFYKRFRTQNKTTPVLLLTAITESEEMVELRGLGNPPLVEKASSESTPDDLWWRLIKLKVLGSRDLR